MGRDTEPKPKRKILDQSPEVVRRWVQVKMIGKGQALARRCMRILLPMKERGRRRALDGAFEEIKRQAIQAERHGYEASATIYNTALYLLIAERDIQATKIDALTHSDWWTRTLAARLILLTLHEWDMDKVAGVRLKQALEDVRAPEELKREAYEALRDVRKVQQRARKELGFLRHATIAHRDPNALAQYRAIRNLDTGHVLGLAGDFYAAAGRFISCIPKLIRAANTIPALLLQMSARRARRERPRS